MDKDAPVQGVRVCFFQSIEYETRPVWFAIHLANLSDLILTQTGIVTARFVAKLAAKDVPLLAVSIGAYTLVDNLVFSETIDVESVHSRRSGEVDQYAMVRIVSVVLAILV